MRSLETGEFIAVNQAFETLTGYGRPDVVGKTPEAIGIFSSIPDHHQNVIRVAREGMLLDRDAAIRGKDGRRIEITFSSARLFFGGQLWIISTMRHRAKPE